MARILVADSDEGIREMLSEFLGQEKHIVVSAATGEEAQGIIFNAHENPFDLVIVGNWLSDAGIKGDQLTFWFEKNYPKVAVILMSGLKEPRDHCADVFFPKPFDVRELISVVNRLLAA